MSIDQKKKVLMDKGDRMSEIAMLMKLSEDFDDSIGDFRDVEARFQEATLEKIIKDVPFKFPAPDGKGGTVTEERYYDDYLNAAMVMTYACDEYAAFDLSEAIKNLRAALSDIRLKPWIRASNPETVDEILSKKIQAFQNALMEAQRSHVRFGKIRFAQAVEFISNKRVIAVEGKTMMAIEKKQSREDEGYEDDDEESRGAG